MVTGQESVTKDEAARQLKMLLAELPWEFSDEDPATWAWTRDYFKVIKQSNVQHVHEALWALQIYFGLQEES